MMGRAALLGPDAVNRQSAGQMGEKILAAQRHLLADQRRDPNLQPGRQRTVGKPYLDARILRRICAAIISVVVQALAAVDAHIAPNNATANTARNAVQKARVMATPL
mgnify:CR=1 FL=1